MRGTDGRKKVEANAEGGGVEGPENEGRRAEGGAEAAEERASSRTAR